MEAALPLPKPVPDREDRKQKRFVGSRVVPTIDNYVKELPSNEVEPVNQSSKQSVVPQGQGKTKAPPTIQKLPPVPEPAKPMPQDTLCSHDVITSITKLLSEAQGLGFNFQPKAIRVDFKDDRKQKIEEYFQKPKKSIVEVEESKQAPEEALMR